MMSLSLELLVYVVSMMMIIKQIATVAFCTVTGMCILDRAVHRRYLPQKQLVSRVYANICHLDLLSIRWMSCLSTESGRS